MNRIAAVLCCLLFGLQTRAVPGNSATFGNPKTPLTESKRASEYARLIPKLRRHGLTVRSSSERVQQLFFSVSARILKVNNEDLQLFEYSTRSAMELDASKISKDGMTIGTSKPFWMAPPHFFYSQKLIVLYVGNDKKILTALEDVLKTSYKLSFRKAETHLSD